MFSKTPDIFFMKFYFFFILLSSITISAEAQDFKDYNQPIPGSSMSIKMVPVIGGEFKMGSPKSEKGRKADEASPTKVTIEPFWMGAYEVTFDQYNFFSDAEKDTALLPDAITRPSPPYIDLTLGMGKSGGFPANSMSQFGAIMFCKWLYNKTGIFFRLPTEAEWEYAARAGSEAPYFFGSDENKLKEYAWYDANSENKYHKVGELKPNAWGLYDIYGNVAEWTMNLYSENNGLPVKETFIQKSSATIARSLRGGSFNNNAAELRSASRMASDPVWNRRDPQIPKSKWWNADAPFIGFRIVRPVKQPTLEEATEFFDKLLNRN